MQVGADGIQGTADDVTLVSQAPDTRDCNSDGNPDNGPWKLIKFTHPYYEQEYITFINALAGHLRNHPQRARIGWVAMGTGRDGEKQTCRRCR